MSQESTGSAFQTQLNIPDGDAAGLVIGQPYYGIGIQPSGAPMRTESVVYRADSRGTLEFDGSIAFPKKPDTTPTKAAASSGEPADMEISYSNYSPTQFNLSTNWSNLQLGFGGLTTSPGPILAANSGQQSMGASQLLSTLDEGPADIGLCWANGFNFGVWIHFNFQMFDIGPRPIWYVSTNGSEWAQSGSDPSSPYTWVAASVGGLSIVGTPNSGHSTLSVSVVISKPS